MVKPEEVKDSKSVDDRDSKAESLCRWGAARAGVIAVIPGLGFFVFIANEIYMIVKMGTIYGVTISTSVSKGFILSVGGRFVGKALILLIPLHFINIPVAISITYGVGKAAQMWIKDGMPENVEKYVKIAENAAEYAQENINNFQNDERKNDPLGEGA